jgi:copper oxidase (laccase) domain-containing protein
MGRDYRSEPAGMLAALGPCIGPACYEVGPEVREGYLRSGFPPSVLLEAPGRPGKSLLDLRAANVWLLRGSGFDEDSILDPASACTHCEPSLLSYRRDPGESRRMYNFIGLRVFDF